MIKQRIVEIARLKFGRNAIHYTPIWLRPLNNLAQMFKARGRFERAKSYYEESLTILEKTVGIRDAEFAKTLSNLAELYKILSEFKKAEEYYDRALEIAADLYKSDHPDVARILHGKAEICKSQKKYEQSDSFYERSRDIWEKAEGFGHDHPVVATSLTGQAGSYLDRGDHENAERFTGKRIRSTREHRLRTPTT